MTEQAQAEREAEGGECLNYDRILEILNDFGITETDTLKHRLEDQARWRRDLVNGGLEREAEGEEVMADTLRALVAKWRRIESEHDAQGSIVGAYAHRACADELEAALCA